MKYWPFGILFLIIFLSLFGLFFFDGNPFEITLTAQPLPPSSTNIFGTDLLGRDILIRIIYGAKYSLSLAFLATFMSITLGTVIGTLSSYNKKLDLFLNSLITLFLAFPYLLLAIAIAAVLKPGFISILLALSLSGWANTARLIRSEVLHLKEETFIFNLKGLGVSNSKILFYHIIPNCFPILCVIFFTHFSTTILAESSLSFIGLGLQPPSPSWGKMIYEGSSYIRIAPWWSLFPGLILTITVLSLNKVGDFLRELFHVKMR